MKFSEINTNKNKLLLLGFLALLFLVLFVFYRLNLPEEKSVVQDANTLSVTVLSPDELKRIIPLKIDSIASLFAIRKEWVKDLTDNSPTEKQTKGKQDKNKKPPKLTINEVLWFSREITIPKDVSSSEFNLALKNSLYELDFDCIGTEDPRSRNLLINIYNKKDSSRKTIGKVSLVFSDNIKRESADICLIINKVEDNSIPDLEKLLSLPDKFSVVLPDIVSRIDAQTVVLDSKRDYVIFADIGTEDDLLAEFKSEMPSKVWRSKVRSMCYEYDKAAAVILLNPKKINPYETDLLTEFARYNLKAYKDTILVKFETEDDSEKKIKAFFSDIIQRSQKGARSIVYLVNFNNEDMQVFRNESFKLKRKGYSFFSLSEIMKRRQKLLDQEFKTEVTG
ncbi:MAG: hypothetical protein WC139_04400 [Candidatus Kapaibacterium sp.]